jgi:hypothetical protein
VRRPARASMPHVPHAKAIRDLAAHFDDYAVGEGWLQKPTAEGAPPSIREQNLAVLLFWADTDGTFIDLGEKRVECARLRRQWPSWRRSSSA